MKKEITVEGTLYINGKNGFVKPSEEYDQTEIYIAPDSLSGAFDGDRVAVSVKMPVKYGMSPEGRIEKILEEGSRIYSGTVRNKGGKNIFINGGKKKKVFEEAEITGDMMNALDNFGVLFELEKYNLRTGYFNGRIVKVFENSKDAGVDITTILAGYGIESGFPDDVLKETEKIPDSISDAAALSLIKKGRMDFRELMTVTVDSEDTKDVDDAVSLTEGKDGSYVLGVHIADVSEYVKESGALDIEAYRRGTSVYPVDRVVPMLPPKLSNGICSLNAGENRLALSVIMTYDGEGNLLKSGIYESVIKVHNKITYRQLYSLLEEKNEKLREEYADMEEMLQKMRKFAQILQKKRRSRGALSFEFPEIKVELDNDGNPVKIGKYETTFANDIIEEFMVAANVTVSETFYKKKMPFMYRIHEEPEREKIEKLARCVKAAGGAAAVPKGRITPAAVSDMLESVKGKPEENSVSYIALRSLQKAEYSSECKGHFGLAEEYYSHFTSPIRRYPDLFIHRIIKKVLRGEMNPNALKHFEEIKEEAAENCSVNERRSAEAEMSVRDYKVIQYMKQFEGETFEGEISSVTGFGFYVRLDNMAEGLVHYNTVSDYMEFDEINMCARGRRTGICYKPGMRLKVTVMRADPDARQLDFELGGSQKAARKSSGRDMKKRIPSKKRTVSKKNGGKKSGHRKK